MPIRDTTFIRNTHYHVFNRGSEKRTIFLTHRDYTNFLHRVKENAPKFGVETLCYCIMPNHFHFLLKQTTDKPLSDFMNVIQLGYAKFFNTKYQRIGPLFQGRFKAKLIESDDYLLQLSAYIHRNPIAHLLDSGNLEYKDSRNLHAQLLSYVYSSYPEYLSLSSNGVASPSYILDYFSRSNARLSYQSFVENFYPDYEALAPLLATTDIF